MSGSASLMPSIAPALVVLFGLGLAAVGLMFRAKQWRQGQPFELSITDGLLSLPKRYLVDVHHIVMSNPFTAIMHMFAAGSFVIGTLLMLIVHGFWASRLLAWILLAAALFLALGASMTIVRRRRSPEHLSGGAFYRIPLGLLSLALFFLLTTLPTVSLATDIDFMSFYGLTLLLIGSYGSMEILGGMAGGPMKHALTGALHLSFHPRPNRFSPAGLETSLLPLDLTEEKLGADAISDFKWTQLLGFDACIQCGRCESVCPAFAADMPLNPKALIVGLAKAQNPLIDFPYTGNPHPGAASTGPAGNPPADTIWACTTCRACVESCPMMIEHVDAIIDLRRFQALDAGGIPGKGSEVLDNLRLCDSRNGMLTEERFGWAADLNLPVLAKKQSCDVLLWFGGSGMDLRGQRTLRAVIALCRRAQVDFAVLGPEELDSGDTARRLGEEAVFQDLARRNIETLSKYDFDRIVTADPHDLQALKNEYTAFGGDFKVIHHTEFLLELVQGEQIKTAPCREVPVTYHDPCYLARYNKIVDAPRDLLSAIGVNLVEMEHSGKTTFCCGGGGAVPITDIAGKRRIPDIRMDQVKETGAASVIVACPGCMSMLEGVTEPRPQVHDIAEIVLQAVEATE